MDTYQIIETLIKTRVNGNSIKGNTTYENMLKRVKKEDIIYYSRVFSSEESCYIDISGTKLQIIENMRKVIDGRNEH